MNDIVTAFHIRDEAKPRVRWWWFGPSITAEEISRELELMQKAGIGGVELAFLYPVVCDQEADSAHNYPFLSETFSQRLRHVAEETKRRGMIMDITLGSGWPYGGPHITEELHARQLQLLSIPLPPHTTRYSLNDSGGHGNVITATHNGRPLLPDRDGSFALPSMQDASQLVLLLSQPTGQQVKRAALGAEGPVLDHYNVHALEAHLKAVGNVLLNAIRPHVPHSIFCDSLEVYRSNWTDNLLTEFAARRGYFFQDFLPLLMEHFATAQNANRNDTTSTDLVQAVMHDYAQSLTDLLHDNFLRPLQQYAHRHGTLSKVQAYGVPPATLASYRYVDIPEGETTLGSSPIQLPADWTEITPNRIAASAGKHFGRAVVSGETWTRLHSPPYAATPLDLKAEADQFFLQGINQIMGHGWCQCPNDGNPSQWVFYAAANLNANNPWHPVMPELFRYLTRVSSFLREGTATADIALYLPDHDVWATRSFSTGKQNLHHINALREQIGTTLPRILLKLGYSFHLIDDTCLKEAVSSGAFDYKAIILPFVERIPEDTLQTLEGMAASGIPVISLGRIPRKNTGYLQQLNGPDTIAHLAAKIFHNPGKPDAYTLRLSELETTLPRIVQPSVFLPQDEPYLGYVRRHHQHYDVYFFVNTSNHSQLFVPQFQEKRAHAYRLDPMKGYAAPYAFEADQLAPYESTVIILTDQLLTREHLPDINLRSTFPLPYKSEHPKVLTEWELLLPNRNASHKMLTPTCWTDFPEHLHHSGSATYRTHFTWDDPHNGTSEIHLVFSDPQPQTPFRVDPERPNTGFRTFLKPPIKDAAIIRLNGKHVGTLLSPPYRIDITKALHPGENCLEIVVYNRLVNQLANRLSHDFTSLHQTYGQRFDPIQDWEQMTPEDSGLVGPVSIHHRR